MSKHSRKKAIARKRAIKSLPRVKGQRVRNMIPRTQSTKKSSVTNYGMRMSLAAKIVAEEIDE